MLCHVRATSLKVLVDSQSPQSMPLQHSIPLTDCKDRKMSTALSPYFTSSAIDLFFAVPTESSPAVNYFEGAFKDVLPGLLRTAKRISYRDILAFKSLLKFTVTLLRLGLKEKVTLK